MSSVGQTLREAREAKGLTLKDIQESTKIQPHYLKAIEEDRFDRLPGHFYTRAFIRTYAEHVGIDPKPLLAEITKPEEDELESVQEFQTLSRRADREREPSFSLAKWFSRGLLILFLVLVGTVIYTAVDGANMGVDFFSGGNSEDEKQTNPENSGESADNAGGDTQEERETEENVEPAVTVEKTSEEGENIYYTVNGTDELTMDVKTSDRVWVEVREGELERRGLNFRSVGGRGFPTVHIEKRSVHSSRQSARARTFGKRYGHCDRLQRAAQFYF